MPAKYAATTTTPVSASQAEIQKVLVRWGATHTMTGSGPDGDLIGFQMNGRQYRFAIRKPDETNAHDLFIAQGGTEWGWRNQTNVARWIDQEWRRRWRAAVLWVKATLEFAGNDEEALQRAFLGSMTLPDGRTFSQWARPQIDAIYDRGQMPPLLGAGADLEGSR